MLTDRWRRRRPRPVGPIRLVTGLLALALTAGLLPASAPAAAAPGTGSPADGVPPGASAIGAGMVADPAGYSAATLPAAGDGDGTVEVEQVTDLGAAACQPLAEPVPPADIDAALAGGPPPTGSGVWQYEVCAASAAAARAIVARFPAAAAAKQYCRPPYRDMNICAVYVRWRPEIPPPPPPLDGGRKGYFDSLDNFAPDLKTSPPLYAEYGLIANLPTWFWSTVRTDVPKVVPGGLAFHLRTTFRTDNREACRVSGLRRVGTIYRTGRSGPPDRPSPTCGYTFRNQGRYEIRGCTQWLFIISVGVGFAAVVIVFTATFCDSDTVPVKEAQVLTGGDPRRGPVGLRAGQPRLARD